MSDLAFELVILKNGSRSIRSLEHGETMHIGTDPVTEARELHVRQQSLASRASAPGMDPLVIWDIGLGPAGNALSAIAELGSLKTGIELHSFEIDTKVLEFSLIHARDLGYLSGWEPVIRRLLDEGEARPTPNIRWILHRGDFSTEQARQDAASPGAIFFDPYSPSRNAEMWTLEVFRSIREAADPRGCTLTNYTRSTSVRVTMLLAGWYVGRGVATGGKEETTLAATGREFLNQPLGAEWLSRVRSSTNAAPLRGGVPGPVRGPISPEDYDRLASHPQFS
jgi:hypothetical protein